MTLIRPPFSATILLVLLSVSPIKSIGAERIAWTSSRIFGSPEPPPPYVSERVIHNHRFVNATELEFMPGARWSLILTQGGQMHGINRQSSEDIKLIADFTRWNQGKAEAYSMTFHPDWEKNHFVYLALSDQTSRSGRVLVVRFELHPGDPPRLDINSGKLIIDWESAGHNGSDLQFGNDGYLYISAGDGEVPAPPDPRQTGQDISDLLACIMRIDVDHNDGKKQYRIPTDNPFVDRPGVRPEIWAYGFRNPWKMSFDPRDGSLWVGDVGWELWEMVFRVDHPGFNGGWSIVEGPQSIHPNWPLGPTSIEAPIISHPHSEASSITGGLVYRGSRLPGLRHAYIYGDWGSGKIWALWWKYGIITKHQELASTPHRIVSFAEDEHGELFYLNYADGAVYQLAPNPDSGRQHDFPTRLSETGLLASTRNYELAPGVHEFDVTAPMWDDHARARRAVAFPGLEKATIMRDYFESPTNSVLVRTLSMEMETGNPDSAKRIETQLLHFNGSEWNGYSYRWNDNQTDAELVTKSGDSITLNIADTKAPGGERVQNWRFHARAECNRCHVVAYQMKHGNLNGFSPVQLASLKHADGATELDRLIGLALIDDSARGAAQLVNPDDQTAALAQRARSYLHANCAHCHRPGSSGAVMMYWPVDFNEERTGAFGIAPQRGMFGIDDAGIVAPGLPGHSALLYRVLTTGTGRMPLIGSREVDQAGAKLLSEWIASLDSRSKDAPKIAETDLNNTASAITAALETDALPPTERETLIKLAMASDNVSTRDLFQRFLPPDERRQTLGTGFDHKVVLTLTGDASRGRLLFFGQSGPQCFTCHRRNGTGRDFGPDLSKVGAKYSKELLLMHIANPNRLVDNPWKAHSINTTDDESYTGFISNKNAANVTIKTALGTETELARSRISSDTELTISLMPEGTLDSLTAQEAADLLEFLVN